MKDELRRERLREYDAALASARSTVAVLVLFAKAREIRAGGERLEEAFAATRVEGVEEAEALPAAVWVALRQGDVDAAIDALIRVSRNEIVLSEHEQVDANYRLTTVEERRAIPDMALLQAQIGLFLQIPGDVVAMIARWGAEDPRTASEVETLIEQRAGAPVREAAVLEPAQQTGAPAVPAVPAAPANDGVGAVAEPAAGLTMSSEEFTALLNLTPEQCAVLHTVVRQTAITIGADRPGTGDRGPASHAAALT
jgi:hypothetical protein